MPLKVSTTKLVWSPDGVQPLVNIPEGVTKVRVSLRPQRFAVLYLKYPDRVEKWLAEKVEGGWQPGMFQGTNAAFSVASPQSSKLKPNQITTEREMYESRG